MAPESAQALQFRWPRIHATCRLDETACFYDTRFCPFYPTSMEQPIFAALGVSELLICTISNDEQTGIIVLLTIKPKSNYGTPGLDPLNSCTWCFVDPSKPLVAVAGESGQVTVFEALTGKLFADLLGHGVGTINDLATHPKYPWIIASASVDTSIRIWDLRRIADPHESKCIIICGHGQVHKEGLLTVGWHRSGRYIVSGGHDQKLCVWTLPDLDPKSSFWQSISSAHRKRSSDDVYVVHFPHFVSSAIHSNYIDKAVFLGDMILSKAAEENKIVLWRITGFNSRRDPPTPETAPKTNEHLDTRSGFVRRVGAALQGQSTISIEKQYQDTPLYQRHLEFASPGCEPFYMRFGLLQPSPSFPHVHPTLVAGNTEGEIRFWDFERLTLGHDGTTSDLRTTQSGMGGGRKFARPKKGVAKRIVRPKDSMTNLTWGHSPSRHDSPESSRRSSSVATRSTNQPRETSTEATSHVSDLQWPTEDLLPDRARYPLDDPYVQLGAHKKITVADFSKATMRSADWSPCGRWCVVTGEWNSKAVAVVLERPMS